jgi:CheY-like chemotaxis protein
LIVDDDAISRCIIQLFLKSYGTAVCVANGVEALAEYEKALAEKHPFDVVFLDMMMPGLNGIQFLEQCRKAEAIHQAGEHVPVVMLTGDANATSINRAQALGVAEYLLKPIQERRLLQTLERLNLIEL